MRIISLIAAGVMALGWGTARAETTPSSETTEPPNGSTTPPPLTNVDVTADPASTTEIEVNTPPGSTVDVKVNPVVRLVPVDPIPVADWDRGPVGRSGVAPTGTGFFVGGGFEDFTDNNLRSMTGSGGYWSARIVDGMRRVVGMEAAYIGNARNIDALGLNSNARLMSNGAEGALRFNIPIMSANQMSLVEPFGFAGLGWSHYAVTNTNLNTSNVASRDDVMTMPVGGGVAFGHRGFMADARFTYRKTYFNDLMAGGGSLDSWGVGGQMGFGF